MKVTETSLPGVYIIEPDVIGDSRGWFMESWSERKLAEFGITNRWIQDNHSYSAEKGILRGLHYQLNPCCQAKIIRATKGSIFDVAVDIRKGSPNFGKWIGEELSAENHKQIYIPRGFAHGFITLTEEVEVQYKADNNYAPECDGNICWNDPEIGILWPIEPVKLSDKDATAPRLRERLDSLNFVYGE